MDYSMLEATVGNTPLVRLQRLPGTSSNAVLVKLEGNNPAGSVKDRPALSMIHYAEQRGEIKPGDTLIEATSGNTGIALAMVAERFAVMKAFGAEIILVSKEASMEGARDLAQKMGERGEGRVLDQFANPDNPRAHYEGTAPEIWRDTQGSITHFVSAMGTTGTIMGTSRYLKEQNPGIEIVGVTPADGAAIPGIRRWPEECRPCRSYPGGFPGGRRAGNAGAGIAGGYFRGHFIGWCGCCCPGAVRAGRACSYRGDYLRSWRPLPVNRSLS